MHIKNCTIYTINYILQLITNKIKVLVIYIIYIQNQTIIILSYFYTDVRILKYVWLILKNIQFKFRSIFFSMKIFPSEIVRFKTRVYTMYFVEI